MCVKYTWGLICVSLCVCSAGSYQGAKHSVCHHALFAAQHQLGTHPALCHRTPPQVIIIVEGIYSMEGETTLLKELVELKKKYK
jgi:7-keto-8-aminopelargonate synthetase-like enzyme